MEGLAVSQGNTHEAIFERRDIAELKVRIQKAKGKIIIKNMAISFTSTLAIIPTSIVVVPGTSACLMHLCAVAKEPRMNFEMSAANQKATRETK
jgi:hypothetical protein